MGRYLQIAVVLLVAACIGAPATYLLYRDSWIEAQRNADVAALPAEHRFDGRIVSVEHRGWQSYSRRRGYSKIDTYFRLQTEDGQEVVAHCLARQSPSLLGQTVTVIAFEGQATFHCALRRHIRARTNQPTLGHRVAGVIGACSPIGTGYRNRVAPKADGVGAGEILDRSAGLPATQRLSPAACASP